MDVLDSGKLLRIERRARVKLRHGDPSKALMAVQFRDDAERRIDAPDTAGASDPSARQGRKVALRCRSLGSKSCE